VSRLQSEVAEPQVQDAATELRRLMAAYKDKRDLIAIGAYERGSDPMTDAAIDLKDPIDAFLRQHVEEAVPAPDADDLLLGVVGAGAPPVLEPELSDDTLARVTADVAPPPALPTGPSAIPPLNLAV